MSDLAKNKAIAKEYFDALTAGSVERLDKILADDLDYWVIGNLQGLSGSHTKPELLGMVPPFSQMWDGPLVFTITGETAEDNRVSLEVRNRGAKKNGQVYNNWYHIAFELRDGQITRIREYFDTMHAKDTILS